MNVEEIERLMEAFLSGKPHENPRVWIRFEHLFMLAGYPVYVAGGGESGYSAYQCVEKARLSAARSWHFYEWGTTYRKLVDEKGETVAFEREHYASWRGGGAYRERHVLPLRPIECAKREHGASLSGYVGYGTYARWETPQEDVVLEPRERELEELAAFLRQHAQRG